MVIKTNIIKLQEQFSKLIMKRFVYFFILIFLKVGLKMDL